MHGGIHKTSQVLTSGQYKRRGRRNRMKDAITAYGGRGRVNNLN